MLQQRFPDHFSGMSTSDQKGGRRMRGACLLLAALLLLLAGLAFAEGGAGDQRGDLSEQEEGLKTQDRLTDGTVEIPVWQFCHAESAEGLDTAVITCALMDCEVGPIPCQDVTEEQLEAVRRLAMYGVVTDRANDMMVTGGTVSYSFLTPEGEYLMSVELYEGWMVGPDGMYNYRSADEEP